MIKYLYKYQAFDKNGYNIDALIKGYRVFSSPLIFNDPYDSFFQISDKDVCYCIDKTSFPKEDKFITKIQYSNFFNLFKFYLNKKDRDVLNQFKNIDMIRTCLINQFENLRNKFRVFLFI